MKSIEISLTNLSNNIYILIDIKNNKITINNKQTTIDEEQINNLLRIIRTWKSNYQNNHKIIDSEKFEIKIDTQEGTDIIIGNGKYPENYFEFKEWIGELYDRTNL